MVEAKQTFPNGAHVSFISRGKGVATKSGVTTDADQKIAYLVRTAFTATFHCSREKRTAPCIPVSPMSVEFSGEITWEAAKRITLSGSGGARSTSWRSRQARRRRRVASMLRGPFPETSREFKVALPPALEDDAGRKLVNADRYPLTVKTGEFPPLAKFASRIGIVEWKGDATLPVPRCETSSRR